ncbi:hypothetical protein EXIGLDRAFT_830490 [Exidia glandulosa HHB12029]|uniref:Uncharacterized protein n=1 Tax=Exidia glandulosa HHB12029 TaxID=1314781 RepID=A0A165NJY6_EXIGL|nr:hypothetical protein EXIGLDRAFT_830490 [Exidia glandulosa HHB12029]
MRLYEKALLLLTLPYISFALGATFNVTVDDTQGDAVTGAKPTYISPPDQIWHARPQEPCPQCSVNLDTSQLKSGTWHDGMCLRCGANDTQTNGISFWFEGTAVYIYGILGRAIPVGTHVVFSIDGEQVGKFDHDPKNSTDSILYNQLFYSNDTVPDGRHEFLMAGRNNTDTVIFFDYAQYTTSDTTGAAISTGTVATFPQPPSSDGGTGSPTSTPESRPASANKSRHTAAVVGAIVAGTALAILIFAALFFILCKCRRARSRVPVDLAPPDYAYRTTASSTVLLPQYQHTLSNPYVADTHATPVGSLVGDNSHTDNETSDWVSRNRAPKIPLTPRRELDSALTEVELLRAEVERLRAHEVPPMYETPRT